MVWIPSFRICFWWNFLPGKQSDAGSHCGFAWGFFSAIQFLDFGLKEIPPCPLADRKY
jgi:hypothetical protein